jgi:hypothetical protein
LASPQGVVAPADDAANRIIESAAQATCELLLITGGCISFAIGAGEVLVA